MRCATPRPKTHISRDTRRRRKVQIASAGFSCSGLGTFGWTSVGRWRTRMSRLGSSRGPRLLNRTRCYPKNGHPTRRFLQSLSARKADSDTVPEVALRSSPSATERNGRHHGLRAGHQSPEANCRQFICFSPLLHRLPRQAPFFGSLRRTPGPRPGHHCRPSLVSMVLRDLHRSAGDKAGEIASWTGLGRRLAATSRWTLRTRLLSQGLVRLGWDSCGRDRPGSSLPT